MGTFGSLFGRRTAAAPPQYRAIAPGVVVTDDAVWGVYSLRSTNSDVKGESSLDREHDDALSAFRVLTGREAHLKVVWGRISGDTYLAGLDLPAVDVPGRPRVREWAETRADSIDELDLPERQVLLSVKLLSRKGYRGSGRSLGLTAGTVSSAEMAEALSLSVQLGRQLAHTLWRAQAASTETIAWSISREMHRGAEIPASDQLKGAQLARLVSGRAEPMPDHLRIVDARGEVVSFVRVLALTDFPEVMVTPGQEWIACLNGLTTVPLMLEGWEEPAPVHVLADVSIRISVLRGQQAVSKVGSVRVLAKEQRIEAGKSSAGEPSDHVLTAEDETAQMEMALQRHHVQLDEDHPRIIISASSIEELEAKSAAVVACYDAIGITAWVAEDEQRDLWLEQLIGDRVRVPDLGHHRDTHALAQSWFWAGSQVGSADPSVPAIGFTTGLTATLVRFLCTEATAAADAPLTLLTGRTRRGKTVAMMLAALDACLAPQNQALEPYVFLPDVKGDGKGLVDAARRFDVPGRVISVLEAHAGALDAFVATEPDFAPDAAAGQLALLLPHRIAADHEDVIQQAVAGEVEAHPDDPRSWRVVASILERGKQDPRWDRVGKTLDAVTRSGYGRLIAGRPSGEGVELSREAGITVLDLPLPQLPEAGKPATDWTAPQRAQVAALRGMLAWCSMMAASIRERRRVKVLAIPEAHVLLATSDGRAWLEQMCRMAAFMGVSLLADSQDVEGIADVPGIVEGLSSTFAFAQRTQRQQQELVRLMRLDSDSDAPHVIATLDRDESDLDGNSKRGVRRGHCLAQDRWGDVATMQWVLPSAEVLALLDTSGAAAAERDERYRASMQDMTEEHTVDSDVLDVASDWEPVPVSAGDFEERP
ncbi:ATP-binding protein [Mobilicoccus caccae]|uniref:AAA domain-containing protein n=1 Tax=Mobilicoccus caccae TaxID=1859295 RepID=A0ABQ6J096_9MICO|nr:ATP-binding protein [Mobilicoccus caccae]GMA42404.1 hypothetical protein GCM10025883_44490 [Mobilicoccus caccae]GMA42479.1 hypothetical protein GCM10025883_45240 [Mobilicoccus caccae]